MAELLLMASGTPRSLLTRTSLQIYRFILGFYPWLPSRASTPLAVQGFLKSRAVSTSLARRLLWSCSRSCIYYVFGTIYY